jgi:hypothetical protein
MVFAIVPDQHETNCVSPVNTKCQPDIQSLASSALLPNQSLVAGKVEQAVLQGLGKSARLQYILFGPAKVNHDNLYMHSFSFAKVLKINDQAVTACTIANGFAVNESRGWRSCVQDLCQRQLLTNRLRRIA